MIDPQSYNLSTLADVPLKLFVIFVFPSVFFLVQRFVLFLRMEVAVMIVDTFLPKKYLIRCIPSR